MVIERIVDAIDPRPGQRVIEIGPGLGALTRHLVARTGHLVAVEIDRDLAARLRQQYLPDQLELVQADALKVDWRTLGQDLRIVGNLPYNVSTPLLFSLLQVADVVRDQHFMLQREVVDRMVAAPGGSDYGRLSVMLQARYRLQRLFHVMPGSFHPVPKVQSSIVRMTPRTGADRIDVHMPALSRVVTAAFGQRRKTLRNALAGLIDEATMRACQVDPGARAETLELAQFVAMAAHLPEAGPEPD